MHDLMHDLATYVCGEFCIRLEDHDFSSDVVSKGRHFSFMQYSSNVDFERFDTIYEAKYLRTFILGNLYSLPTVQLDLLLLLQCLRVVKLRGRSISELPDSISNLKHLRYLDVCNTRIQKLPDTVCSLYNLQTLLLSWCYNLAELPADLGRLINLRHLDFRGTGIKKTPLHEGKLKDLRTLRGEFVLSKDAGGNIAELKGHQYLRGTLHISGLQNIKRAEDALEAKLRGKKLSELLLEWEGDTIDSQNDRRVLSNLQPHTNLKVLQIERYGGTAFPSWLGDESFSNLVNLRLVGCRYCFSLPAVGQLPSLKELEIDGLNEVESVGSEFYGGIKPAFRSLEFLRFNNMCQWQEWCFPAGEEEGRDFPNLRELSLDKCPKLTGKIPLDSFPRLELLKGVTLESLACLQECNKFRIELASLLKLEISNCPNLVCFVGGGVLLAPKLKKIDLYGLKNLWSMPEEMQISLPSLQHLSIRNCLGFEYFPQESQLPSLYELEIQCPNFVSFPPEGGLQAPNLKEMSIIGSNKFRSLPADMHASLPSLQRLSIERCEEFKSFPEESKFPSLERLGIYGCPEFVSFPPEGGLQAPNLKEMSISECNKFRSLPEEMCTLVPSLEQLSLQNCPEFESFPEGGLPSKFSSLIIWRCKKLMANRMRWGLQTLTSFKRLDVVWLECEEEEEIVESFPEEGLLPATLTSLNISFLRNLKTIDGKALRHLISRERLKISHCPQLQSLPDEGLPTSLSELDITGSDLLTQRCQRNTGEDWAKISHIPSISIENEKDTLWYMMNHFER